MEQWEEHRILIWGKTYPEISAKYYETVCTGGTLEDGRFIRLYPIPFRYLADQRIFTKYQWIRARIKKSREDPRPESYKIDPESIVVESKVESDKYGWNERSLIIQRNAYYQFSTVDQLLNENRKRNTSMGFVRPYIIEKIEIEKRPDCDYETFLRKLGENKERLKQTEMFPILTVTELKALQYISERFKIHWRCHDPSCTGHKMSVLDWEAYELVRNVGVTKALEKLNSVLNLDTHLTGFFLGNFRLHPRNFAIGGIWYPKKTNLAANLRLFD